MSTISFAGDVVEWQKQFGGNFEDKALSVLQTADGGSVFVGWTESTGAGGKDGWVVKLTPSGDVAFEKTFGGVKNDYLCSVDEDYDGGFVACGQKQNEQSGYLDTWVIRIDKSGQLDWEKTYAVSAFGSATFVSYNAEDKLYTLIASREEKTDHDLNVWWMKLNKKGAMTLQSVSSKRFINDEALTALSTADGSTITAGYIADKFNDKNVGLSKIDKRGTELWSQNYGVAKNDYAVAVIALSEDRLFVCANTESKGQGGSDAWVLIVDKNGRILAENTVGGVGSDVVNSAVAVPGGYMLVGKTDTKSKGKSDNWIVKIDNNLKLVWEYSFGTYAYDELQSVTYSPQTKTFIAIGNCVKPGEENTNAAVFKINDGINEEKNREPKAVAAAGQANSPVINITAPMVRRGFKTVVSDNTIEIKGTVAASSGLASVLVNGKEAMLASGGNFSAQVSLQTGSNNISIRAVEKNGTEHLKDFTIDKAVDAKSGESVDFNSIKGKYYALLIGVEDYKDDAINDLDRPIDDATMLYNTLTTYYSFDKENVFLLKNPGRSELIVALDDMSKRITAEDNFLIFYAGHGYWDPDKSLGYWLPSDASKANTANWVANSTVRDYVSSIKSKHTLLIADACFSGGIFKTRAAFTNSSDKAISLLYGMNSRKAMTSGTLKEVPDQSVFVEYLNKRLINNDKEFLTSEDLFSQFRMAVINNSPNVPQYGTIKDSGDEGGEFIFVRKK